MSNEVKIGLLAIVAIGLSFWGYKFIQGSNLFSNSKVYYVYYDDVAGLQVGTPVTISGVNVGSVTEIELSQQDRKVRVTLDINKDINVPQDSRAVIATSGLLGGKTIYLIYAQPCFDDCAESGATLLGDQLGMLESMLGVGATEEYMDQLKGGISSAVDSLNEKLLGENSDSPIAQSARDLRATMGSLKTATARVDLMLQRVTPQMEASLANLNRLTSTLNAQRATIESVLENADTLSQQLVDAQLNEAIEEVKATVTQLRGTLSNTNDALSGVSEMVDKVQAGQGTLGKLIYDEELYQNLYQLSERLDGLATDLEERPYRYIPLKSRSRVLKYDRQDENLKEEQAREKAASMKD